MKTFISIISFIFLLSGCKKSSPESSIPPGNPNHEVKAMVSVKSGPFSSFNATGNYTLYGKRTETNGDAIIVFSGSSSLGKIQITLVNINSAGTYTFGGGGPAGSQYVVGSFEIGNPVTGPVYELFLTPTPPPPLGSITIDEFTSSSIRGSFSMTCSGSTGTIQITNGTFKGTL